MNPVEVKQGTSPIILAMPHSGIWLPDELRKGLNARGQKLQDTDWHIPKLYANLLPDASVIQANFHRYVIDANRDPAGLSLYPGQNTTTLCPLIDFDNQPIWQQDFEPDEQEINRRIVQFHTPYHQAIERAIVAAKAKHGYAILYDCHSIRSEAEFLFEGILPSLNIGTNDGQTCAKNIQQEALKICEASPYNSVVNGRFKGGWTTRHYGKPTQNIHAIQMEITQKDYMNESEPFDYDSTKAEALRKTLKTLLTSLKNLNL